MMDDKKKDIIFEESENTWGYVKKEVDLSTFQINYIKQDGYTDYGLAEIAYQKDMEHFEKDMVRLREITGMRFTFSSYLKFWYQQILQPYASGSYQVGYCWCLYDIILPNIQTDLLINMVNVSYLNQLLKACSKTCVSAGPMCRKMLNVAFRDAIADGYIQRNPMNEVDSYSWDTPEIVILTKEQIKTLLQAAYEYHAIYLEVLLAIFCGLRQGEILGLKYDDFDESQMTVTINRQITRDYKVVVKNDAEYKILSSEKSKKPPKSFNSYRTLRIPPVVMHEVKIRKEENIKALSRDNMDKTWSDYICLGQNGNIKSDSTLREALSRICNRYSLPKVGMHALRHIFASILIEQSTPLSKISKLMGHKHIGTTFDIYCGIIQAKEQIREYIGRNMDPLQEMKQLMKKEG